jgi:hypothetical protein
MPVHPIQALLLTRRLRVGKGNNKILCMTQIICKITLSVFFRYNPRTQTTYSNRNENTKLCELLRKHGLEIINFYSRYLHLPVRIKGCIDDADFIYSIKLGCDSIITLCHHKGNIRPNGYYTIDRTNDKYWDHEEPPSTYEIGIPIRPGHVQWTPLERIFGTGNSESLLNTLRFF